MLTACKQLDKLVSDKLYREVKTRVYLLTYFFVIMAAERWNSEKTIKFIQEFKSYECLWNHKSALYKNKLAKDAAYEKIVEEMNIAGFGVPEAKKKMRTLRSTYYQEKKKIQNSMRSGSGTDTVYVPNLHWYKEMDSLLKDIDERRTTIENVSNKTTFFIG